MTEPDWHDDLRLWIDRHEDHEHVKISVGDTGFADMTVAEFRLQLQRHAVELAENLARGGGVVVILTDTPPGGRSIITGTVQHLTRDLTDDDH